MIYQTFASYKINFNLKGTLVLLHILVLFLIPNIFLTAQELPPIESFSPKNYNAGNQNWMISQDSKRTIYIANNDGLLTYNGANFKLYPSPNQTILRSVKVVDDLIYTGCFMEFGYWEKGKYGYLKYHSLTNILKEKMVEDEHVWNILDFDNLIVFQTFSRLYIYNLKTETINILKPKNRILKVFKVKDVIYYQDFKNDIFKLNKGKLELFCSDSLLKNVKVIDIFMYEKELLFITDTKGVFKYKNKTLKSWKSSLNKFFNSITIYSSVQINNNNFAIGTISKGVFIISSKGEILHQIKQKNGLSNNTALSLFTDTDKNLWVGLDNGISVLNLESPITTFADYDGIIGTVYSAIVYKGYLYLGTNQGLFCKEQNSKNKFSLVKGTKGQVWSLQQYNDELFCGHNSGIFLINSSKARLISPVLGTWDIKPIPNYKDLLLLGSYDGLYIVKKSKGIWKLKNKLAGFNISSRFFEFKSNNEIWVNHEYKGVYKLIYNNDLTKFDSVVLKTTIKKGKNSSIVKYNGKVLYAFNEGIFSIDKTGTLVKETTLISNFNKNNYISGKLVTDKSLKLWTFSKNDISYISPSQLDSSFNTSVIPISNKVRKGMNGFENILMISKDLYLLGNSNGYLKMNLSSFKEKKHEININSIFLKDKNSKITNLALTEGLKLKNNQNSIKFNYSVAEFDKFTLTEYQYKLHGLYDKWSEWSSQPDILFENLKHNDYKFSVRAKVGSYITKSKTYDFSIKKPWYLSITAMLIYVLLLIGLTLVIHRAYRWYYSKQYKNTQLKSEQLIMTIKNEKLSQAIESKNKELAISTMSLIKKNKVLSSIKKELTNNMTNNEIKSVVKLIDRNLNDEKDWKFFEEAFNNADKNFLNKLKSKHANLTPNDLRFCAYLRLNLSSKEIAPLLNITVRSIEIKRYRLRKKMNLDHSVSLVKYILDI